MKKLMVSTIILLPILLLAIMLVSAALIPMFTHVYVESVEFVENDVLVLTMSDENAPPTYDVTDEITILPVKAKNRDLKFASDDESIVTIDENGVVKASYYGETFITVASKENKAARAMRRVRVTDKKVHVLSFDMDKLKKELYPEADPSQGDEVELYQGKQLDLNRYVSIIPNDPEVNKSITWTCDNDEVLRLLPNGIITALGAGKVTVTATSKDDPAKSDTITFNCHKRLTGFDFDTMPVVSSSTEFKLPAVTPSPAAVADDIKITYASSNEKIATVDEAGNVKFSQKGQVTIAVTVTDFGGTFFTKYKSYTSTDGYYMQPLFSPPKNYTVNYDEYKDGLKPLPIEFAPNLTGTYREFKEARFSIEGVLRVDAEDPSNIKFYFVGEMPADPDFIYVEVDAYVYKEKGENEAGETELFSDHFTLNVVRDVTSVAVSYGETKDVGSIILHENDDQKTSCSLKFDTSSANAGPAYAIVNAQPANHTNKMQYSLAEGDEDTATITAQGKLTFKSPGKVTVIISFLDANDHVTIEKKVIVTYVPIVPETSGGEEDNTPPPQAIEIVESEEGEPAPEQPPIVLEITPPEASEVPGAPEEEKKQEGILYFAEPAGATVTYTAENDTESSEPGTPEEPDKDPVVKIEERDGVQYIVPQRGGFATITITVTPDSPAPVRARRAKSEQDGVKVYKFKVYVNRPVHTKDFTIKLGDEQTAVDGDHFYTTATSIAYAFSVKEEKGSMQGKKLYVTFGNTTWYGENNAADFVSTLEKAIAFAEDLGDLKVTFGVEYTEEALELKANPDNLKKANKEIFIGRNASEIKVAYGGIDNAEHLVITDPTLTFGTTGAAARVTVLPASHTDTTIVYSVVGEGATMNSGTLTFTKASTVTVKIQTMRGGTATRTKEIAVTYLPTTNQDIDLGTSSKTEHSLLLSKNGKANLYLSVPQGVEAKAQIDDDAVVTLQTVSEGAYTLTAQKGGFATVTVTAGEKEYTVHAYVDVPVTASDFTVAFGSENTQIGASDLFCTTLDSVPFTVTFTGEDGAMEGKRFYVSYSETKEVGTANAAQLTGKNIAFDADLSELSVTIGVEYAEGAKTYGKEGTMSARTVTLYRNPSELTFNYNHTENVATISTSREQLSFTTFASSDASQIHMEITPATYDREGTKIEYELIDTNNVAKFDHAQLTFSNAGTVTVKVKFIGRDTNTAVEKSITITYAPYSGSEKAATIDDDNPEINLLLFMPLQGNCDTGRIDYTESASDAVEYKSDDDTIASVEKKGTYHVITPKKGGFTTVTVTATPRGDGVTRTYTINIFVDRAVNTSDFTIDLKGADTKGTTLTSVPFEVTVDNANGQMEGKRIYVKGVEGKGQDDQNTFSDAIPFPATGDFTVTFGVEYTDEAKTFKADAQENNGLISVERKILNNTKTITFTNDNIVTQKLVTSDPNFSVGKITAFEPKTHTDTFVYSVTDGAAIDEQTGVLTFTKGKAATVTVTVEAKRGETVTKSETIEISYVPTANATAINVNTEADKNIVLKLGDTDEVIFYYTLPTTSTAATCEVTGEGIVTLEEDNNTWHVKPAKGGFAAVTLKAGEKTYTLNVFVDAAVRKTDLEIEIDDADTQGTIAAEVSFTVTVANADGKMEGKQVVVTYGESETVLTGTVEKREGETYTLTGTIPFAKTSATLAVTFKVEYTTKAIEAYHVANSSLQNVTATKTLQRNAETLTVDYKGVAAGKIVTDQKEFAIGSYLQISPDAHSDAVSYSIVGESNRATITENGTLTFQKAGSITVAIEMKRVGQPTPSISKQLTVSYAPAGSNVKKIDLSEEGEKNIVLNLGTKTETAIFYFVVPEGKTVSCDATEGKDEIVELVDENGTWHVTPLKGGFATVTLTIDGMSHNVHFYVDVPVAEGDFTIQLQTNKKPLNHVTVGEYISSVYYEEEYLFHTFYDNVSGYTVTMANTDGSMAGKKLYVEFDGVRLVVGEDSAPTLSSSTQVMLDGTEYHKFTFGVEYIENAKAFIGATVIDIKAVDRFIRSTHGTLLSKPAMQYYNSDQYGSVVPDHKGSVNPNSPTTLLFDNPKTTTIVLAIDLAQSFDPADFALTYSNFSSSKHPDVIFEGDADISIYNFDSGAYTVPHIAKIILKANSVFSNETVTLKLFGQTFEFNASVKALAETIEVKGGTGEDLKTLDGVTKYKTLLDTLDFKVTLGRIKAEESDAVTNKKIEWSYTGKAGEWKSFGESAATLNINIKDSPSNSLFFRSEDGGAEIQILIEHIANPDFNLLIYVGAPGEGATPFATINNVENGEALAYTLPGNLGIGGDSITFKMEVNSLTLVGGYGAQDIAAEIDSENTEPKEGWDDPYVYDDEIIFKSPTTLDFKMKCQITCYGKTITVSFTHYNLSLLFPGFDSENKTDVYKGYQQVRVFAKHSYYAVEGTQKLVDFFPLPFKAYNSTTATQPPFDSITWTFTGIKGDTKMSGEKLFELSQTGKQVTFNGKHYLVVPVTGKPSNLVVASVAEDTGVWTATDTVIAENGTYKQGADKVPWVDMYAEDGYAYLYFGSFTGLSETDVQNNYFGDFDDKFDGKTTTWAEPTKAERYGITGAEVTPSDGAFTFLNVSAKLGEGDTAGAGENAKTNSSFNFNILADDALVNVFNATGYYANQKVVLHNNLYGNGELEGSLEAAAKASDQILDRDATGTRDANYQKNTVYGNGYQINLNKLNEWISQQIKDGKIQNAGKPENTGSNTIFNNLYNVRLMGRNHTEKIITSEVCVYFTCDNIYYTDLQYYGKMNNGTVRIKNSVLHNISMPAVELWAGGNTPSNNTAYLENIVIVNAMRGIICEHNAWDSPNHAAGTPTRHTVNIKGTFDVLNYHTVKEITSLVPVDFEKEAPAVLSKLQGFGEWLGGKKPVATVSSTDVFINPAILATQCEIWLNAWDESKNEYVALDVYDSNKPMPIAAALDDVISGMHIGAYTYDYDGTVDTGTGETRDWSKLFTDQRQIRLLCEFLDILGDGTPVRNDDHILWHMQEVYRDTGLIEGRMDHIDDLKQSLQNAVDSGRWDGTWPDGSTLQQALAAAPAALTRMLSETVLPGKAN